MSSKLFLPTVLFASSIFALGGQALAFQSESDAANDETADSSGAAEQASQEAQAAGEDDAPVSELAEWEALDAELRGLSGMALEEAPMADIWGYGAATFSHQKVGTVQGVSLGYMRVNVTGQVSSFTYRLTTDFASGNARFEDAWLSAPLAGPLQFTIGRFKTPFLQSGLIEARDLLFISRTRNGVYYSQRDEGVMLNADHGRFHWSVAVQNGENPDDARTSTTIRTSFDILGSERLAWEGAYQAGEKTHLSVGAGYSHDHTQNGPAHTSRGGAAIGAELSLVHKRFSFAAEFVRYGSAYSVPAEGMAEQRGSTSPWSATASYMLVPDKYELALRYDDFDDNSVGLPSDPGTVFDRRTVTVGINRYLQGHHLKWQFNYGYAHKGGIGDGRHDPVVALGLLASF